MKVQRNFRFLLLLILAFALASPGYASEVGKVSRMLGKADVTRGSRPAIALNAGDKIFEQDIIRTKSRSLVVITMKDRGQLTLAAKTRMEVAKYVTGSKPKGLIRMTRGRVRAFVTHEFSKRSESFQVKTPTAVAGVQGTDFGVAVRPNVTDVAVYSGRVVVFNIDPSVPGRVVVKPGMRTSVKEGEPPTTPVPFDMTTGSGWGGNGLGRMSDEPGGTMGDDLVVPEPMESGAPMTEEPPPTEPTVVEPVPEPEPPTETPPDSKRPMDPPGQSKPVKEHPSGDIPPGLDKPRKGGK